VTQQLGLMLCVVDKNALFLYVMHVHCVA